MDPRTILTMLFFALLSVPHLVKYKKTMAHVRERLVAIWNEDEVLAEQPSSSLWGILALKLDPGMSIEAYTTREVAFRSRLVAYARGLGAAHFDLQKSALLNDMDLVGAAATMFGRKITVTRSEGTYTIFPHEVADQHNDLHIKYEKDKFVVVE